MGKRKNANQVLSTPKKEKKTATSEQLKSVKSEKRPAAEEPSDSEREDYDEDHNNYTEAEETKNDVSQMTYEPDVFRAMVESFQDFISIKQTAIGTVHHMEKTVTEWAETRKEDNIDASLFIIDYRKYLKSSIKFRNFHLNDASATLIAYLRSEKSLNEFKSFPERPPTKFHLYCKQKQITCNIFKKESLQNAQKAFNDDPVGIQEAEEKIRDLTLQYIPQLQEFLDLHPDLTADQKRFIANRIKALDKKFIPKEPVQKTPKKKSSKKEPETAYSLFCKSRNDQYRDLSEEEREKKLQKKFKKLSEAEKDLLQSLVLNM